MAGIRADQMKLAAAVALALLAPMRVASAAEDFALPVVWECASGVIVVEGTVQPEARAARAGCTKASPAADRAALRAIEAWQPALDRMPPRELDAPCPGQALVQPNYAFKPTAHDGTSGPCRASRAAA